MATITVTLDVTDPAVLGQGNVDAETTAEPCNPDPATRKLVEIPFTVLVDEAELLAGTNLTATLTL